MFIYKRVFMAYFSHAFWYPIIIIGNSNYFKDHGENLF